MICKICKKNGLNKYWVGKARETHFGTYSKEISTAYKCKNCDSIIVSHKKDFDNKLFISGYYRSKVDKMNNYTNNDINKIHQKENISYLNYIKQYFPTESVLDFGCGAGGLLKIISRLVVNPVGIDLDERLQSDIYKFKIFKNFKQSDKILNTFDIIILKSTLGMIKNIKSLLKQCIKRLKKNGYLIISDPNPNDLRLLNNISNYDHFFFRKSYRQFISEKGYKAISRDLNLKFIKSNFIERYEYDNIKSFVPKNIYSKYTKDNFKNLVTKENQTDYLMVILKK